MSHRPIEIKRSLLYPVSCSIYTVWDNGTFLFSYFKHFLNFYIFIFSFFVFIYILKMFEIRENKCPIVPRIRKCSRLERGTIRYLDALAIIMYVHYYC